MTRTCLRTWIGEHPLWTVALVVGAWLAACAGILYALSECSWIPPYYGVRLVIPLTAVGLPGAGAAAVTFLVGLHLGRSGRQANRLLWTLLWTPAIAWLAVVLLFGLANPEEFLAVFTDLFMFVTILGVGMGVAAAVSAGQVLGWAAAALVTARQISAGRWEIIAAAPGVRAERTTAEWLARHPALGATFALAGSVFGADALLLVAGLMNLGRGIPLYWTPRVSPVAAGALIAWTALIGCLMARAGRRPAWLLLAAPVVPLVAALRTLYVLCFPADYEDWPGTMGYALAALKLSGGLLLCIIIGWAAAALVTWLMQRRGEHSQTAPGVDSRGTT